MKMDRSWAGSRWRPGIKYSSKSRQPGSQKLFGKETPRSARRVRLNHLKELGRETSKDERTMIRYYRRKVWGGLGTVKQRRKE